MNAKILILVVAQIIFLMGCSSLPKARVVETETGILQSFGTAKEEPDARMSAIEQAQKYCNKRDEKSVFQDRELRAEGKKEGLNLSRLPIIGQALKGNDKTQVVLSFRCAKKT